MYFEDIYKKIRPYWKESFSLDNISETETYVSSIKENYNDIEYIVDHECSNDFSEWESMLVFTMYQAITAHAIERWKEESVNKILLSDIPLRVLEEYYRRNLEPEDECDGSPEYLEQYKGLKELS